MASQADGNRGNRRGGYGGQLNKRLPIVIGLVSLFAAISWAVQAAVLRIVIIGDSTVKTYTDTDPLKGWGQEIIRFFVNGSVTVTNFSEGGRSSRSFIEDGHWATALASLEAGNYLLIQFGHNDRDTKPERYTDTAGYRKYLTQYVKESRAKGAIPVLVSPMNMNTWNGETLREVFNEGANDYHAAMLRVVEAEKVPFIDLEKKTAALYRSLGQSYLAKFLFHAGESTHFVEMGALMNAHFIAEGIKELAQDPEVGKLAAVLAPQYPVTVNSNKAGAGMITVSGTYPEGAPITLNVIPNSGQTFQRWQDATGQSLTTQTQYQFTMGAGPAAYYAMFAGGSTGSLAPRVFAGVRPVSMLLATSGRLTVEAREPMLSLRLTDLAGKTLALYFPNNRRMELTVPAAKEARAVKVTTKNGAYSETIRPIE